MGELAVTGTVNFGTVLLLASHNSINCLMKMMESVPKATQFDNLPLGSDAKKDSSTAPSSFTCALPTPPADPGPQGWRIKKETKTKINNDGALPNLNPVRQRLRTFSQCFTLT